MTISAPDWLGVASKLAVKLVVCVGYERLDQEVVWTSRFTGTAVVNVRFRVDEAALLLPAASVSVAMKLWLPVDKAAVAKFQVPLAFAVAVPSCIAPSNTATWLLASAVPLRVTTLVGEMELLLITGLAGATVSTVTLRAEEAALVVPDTVSVAVKLWVAFDKAPVVKLQAPLPFAVTLPRSAAPS